MNSQFIATPGFTGFVALMTMGEAPSMLKYASSVPRRQPAINCAGAAALPSAKTVFGSFPNAPFG